jgi:predicted nucleic acid-binding protein
MKYLMDANSVIHLIADAFPKLTARVAESDAGSIGVSSVAFAEGGRACIRIDPI